MDDLNGQHRQWLDEVAKKRTHATTRRVVCEHFADEQPHLKPLPAGPFQAVLRLDRRVTRDGMVSVGGNPYSVTDGTRRRAVEVQTLAHEVRILDATAGRLNVTNFAVFTSPALVVASSRTVHCITPAALVVTHQPG